MLDPGRGRVKEGYFWVVARDDRSWAAEDPQAMAFAYAPGRGAIHGLKLLDDYRGSSSATVPPTRRSPPRHRRPVRSPSACRAYDRRFFDHAKGEAPIPRGAERIAESMRSRRRSEA